jgi:hypothetical protein
MAGCIVLVAELYVQLDRHRGLGRATNADACGHREVTVGKEEPPCF